MADSLPMILGLALWAVEKTPTSWRRLIDALHLGLWN